MRIKLNMRGLMLSVAVVAIPLTWASDKTGQRRDRCLDIADRHARLGAEYRRNSGGTTEMVRIADWHDYMSRCFEKAADDVWGPIPISSPFPTAGWSPTSTEAASVSNPSLLPLREKVPRSGG